jgi:hypothetical protein
MMTEGAAFELPCRGKGLAKTEAALVKIAALIDERNKRRWDANQFRREPGEPIEAFLRRRIEQPGSQDSAKALFVLKGGLRVSAPRSRQIGHARKWDGRKGCGHVCWC